MGHNDIFLGAHVCIKAGNAFYKHFGYLNLQIKTGHKHKVYFALERDQRGSAMITLKLMEYLATVDLIYVRERKR